MTIDALHEKIKETLRNVANTSLPGWIFPNGSELEPQFDADGIIIALEKVLEAAEGNRCGVVGSQRHTMPAELNRKARLLHRGLTHYLAAVDQLQQDLLALPSEPEYDLILAALERLTVYPSKIKKDVTALVKEAGRERKCRFRIRSIIFGLVTLMALVGALAAQILIPGTTICLVLGLIVAFSGIPAFLSSILKVLEEKVWDEFVKAADIFATWSDSFKTDTSQAMVAAVVSDPSIMTMNTQDRQWINQNSESIAGVGRLQADPKPIGDASITPAFAGELRPAQDPGGSAISERGRADRVPHTVDADPYLPGHSEDSQWHLDRRENLREIEMSMISLEQLRQQTAGLYGVAGTPCPEVVHEDGQGRKRKTGWDNAAVLSAWPGRRHSVVPGLPMPSEEKIVS